MNRQVEVTGKYSTQAEVIEVIKPLIDSYIVADTTRAILHELGIVKD